MERNLNKAEQNSIIINTEVPTRRHNEGFVKFKDTLYLFAGNWKWFVLSLIIALSAAYYYLQITPNVYVSTTSIMIKAEDSKGASEDLLNELGIRPQGVNITNEIMSMKTIAVTSEIVKRLKLNTDYFHSGAFHDNLAYAMDLPVRVEMPDLLETDVAKFDLQLKSDSTISISSLTLNNQELDGSYSFKLGQTVKTPLGIMQVAPTSYYVGGMKDNLTVERKSMRETVNDIHSRIIATQRDQKASIIDISFNDVSRARGEDILSTLVAVYNENWVKDRNQITTSTTEFIKDRLAIIEGELGNVDNDISDYKSRNLMTDVSTMGGIAVSQMTASESQGREIDNRMYMTKYIRNYLTDGLHEKEQLPANSGIDNPSIEAQIQAYNALLLQRNNHLSVSSEQNPLVMAP
ncbi:MAG: chromosome partitioning protein ParA, partial [Duncaniella sp.]|nr:chromosome partitioning protein ParA [Duncaniella sp.]